MIAKETLVSCYVDAAAFLVMILLLVISGNHQGRRVRTLRIFHLLCVCITANCVFPFIQHAMYLQTAPWCHTAAVIAKTLRECVVVFIVGLWLIYVDYELYGDKNQRRKSFLLAFVPLGAVLVVLVVNLFTGIAFTFSPENNLEIKPLLYCIFLMEFIYFCSSAVVVRYYDKKIKKIRFLHVSPMIASLVVASCTQFFAPYDIGVLGYVIGITLLYFSLISEIRYVDEESGLYNKGYLAYLFDMAISGTSNAHSALILEADGNLPVCFDILNRVLHQDGDVIRMEERKFLMFSHIDSRSTMQYLSSKVDEEVEKHNAAHPEDKIRMTVRCRMRTQSEDAFTFLRTVMDEKEAGDTMRGIVSMMSELDRLDKELALASEIQLSILPAGFPAFPDRTEMDLYASMDPAKEVGGDFYDYFLIDQDHLAVVIADVSGKGIPAALFMMVSKTLIKNQLMSGCDPAAALERVNQQLCERNSSMMFVTVWLAVMDLSTGTGLAVNAGHENPALRRAGADFELIKYRHGVFLGVNRKATFENREFQMHPGDCVFVYTDGVPEATNAGNEMFGEDRMTETLNRNPDADPATLIRTMQEALEQFSEGAPQFDDITMLCLKYHGPQADGGET